MTKVIVNTRGETVCLCKDVLYWYDMVFSNLRLPLEAELHQWIELPSFYPLNWV